MAKILCVLYDDPKDGYPTSYARDDIPKIEGYPGGQTAPSPKAIDFTPGGLSAKPSSLAEVRGEDRDDQEGGQHEHEVADGRPHAIHPAPEIATEGAEEGGQGGPDACRQQADHE